MRAVQRIWLDRYSWGSSTKIISISVSNGPHVIWHVNRSSSCNAARAQVASIENLIDRYTGVRPTVSLRSRQWPSNSRVSVTTGEQATTLTLARITCRWLGIRHRQGHCCAGQTEERRHTLRYIRMHIFHSTVDHRFTSDQIRFHYLIQVMKNRRSPGGNRELHRGKKNRGGDVPGAPRARSTSKARCIQ